jgi:hypothetical protein
MANTRRMNRLEELGRVDSEKAYTKKGKRNLRAEKKRVVKEIKKAKQGYYAREDESIAMRRKKKRTKAQLVASRNESYGKWGKRGKDWKKKVVKARTGTMVNRPSTQGFGAARTSGTGLQDESLQPGQTYVQKGGDYIKDLI